MRKHYTFRYPSAYRALDAAAQCHWYVVQQYNMRPPDRMLWAKTEWGRERWPDQALREQPATLRKWLRRKSAGKDTAAMYVGELVLADGSVVPLAKIDRRRERRLFNAPSPFPDPDW